MTKDKDLEYGVVYLLTNECMPGLVKIGMTSRKEMDARMKELYTTGVPMPFECAYACKVKLEFMSALETALHTAFAPQRVNENREFFRISPEQAIPMLKIINHFHDADVTADVTAEISNDLTDEDKKAIAKAKVIRRPPLNYYRMGLKDGQILEFVQDPSITCTITGERKVMFNGEDTSLTRLTMNLLGKSQAVQPTGYWTIDGRNLMDLYDETYPIEEENF